MQSPLSCPIRREVDVYVAMSRAREITTTLGMGDADRTRVEIAILELTRNILVHAVEGQIEIVQITHPEHGLGIMIEAVDHGPGIADINLALQDGYSTAHTLGAGLPGVRRLMDEFQIESTLGVGTRVRAVKWLHRPQRRMGYGD
ncbi:MAG: anti-sigma regulatory factor [Oscillochloridaceae bacterium umkhey_bin13]